MEKVYKHPPFPCCTNANVLCLLHSYCEDLKVGDWEATIKSLKRETTQDFFLYVCENSKITSWGSGEEYIRQFQQLYTTVTGQYMDRNDAKEVYKVRGGFTPYSVNTTTWLFHPKGCRLC